MGVVVVVAVAEAVVASLGDFLAMANQDATEVHERQL